MKQLSGDLLLTIFGAVTTLIAAIVLHVVERQFEFSLYTWYFLFIIPVGAIASGFAAATGYWVGAKLVNQRPTPRLLISIVLLSVSAFFLIHFLSYASLEVDGAPLSSSVSFGSYLQAVHSHTSMTFRFRTAKVGSTGELGSWGYLFGLLEVVGFAIGGTIIYGAIKALPFCGQCERYLKRSSREQRFSADPEQVTAFHANASSLLASGRVSDAASAHAAFGDPKADKKSVVLTELSIWRCTNCTHRLVRLATSKRSGNEWQEIPDLRLETETDAPIITASRAS